jgi:NAD+ kinase
MKSVAIVSKPEKPELSQIVPELMGWLRQRNYEVHIDHETATYLSEALPAFLRADLVNLKPDFAIVLGGDGTLLSAARAFAQMEVPLLGVNLGSLGFLTEVPLGQLYPTLEQIENNHSHIESRSMIYAQLIRDDECIGSYHVLNDAVINKNTIARLAHLEIRINGTFVSTYKGDGIIVSTPTGSTAYSLSAGGPVLTPMVEALVISPICAHALSHRPLVVRDSVEIEILVQSSGEPPYLSLDGQIGLPIMAGDRLLCKRSPYQTKLFRLRQPFFEILRTKLNWGQR